MPHHGCNAAMFTGCSLLWEMQCKCHYLCVRASTLRHSYWHVPHDHGGVWDHWFVCCLGNKGALLVRELRALGEVMSIKLEDRAKLSIRPKGVCNWLQQGLGLEWRSLWCTRGIIVVLMSEAEPEVVATSKQEGRVTSEAEQGDRVTSKAEQWGGVTSDVK